MRRVCIINPDTNRCVFSDTTTGKNVIKKHGIIYGNCKFDEITSKCIKTRTPPPPQPPPPPPPPRPKTRTPPPLPPPPPPRPKTRTPPPPKSISSSSSSSWAGGSARPMWGRGRFPIFSGNLGNSNTPPTSSKSKTRTPPSTSSKSKTRTPPSTSRVILPRTPVDSFNYIPNILTPATILTQYLTRAPVNTCDLKTLFEDGGFNKKSETLIPKNSASDSVVTKLDLENNISIIFKISAPRPGPADSELYTEMLIYEFVSQFKLPFVINYVAHFTCDNKDTLFKFFNKKTYDAFLGLLPYPNINILITEACNSCRTLYDFYKKTDLQINMMFNYEPNYYSIFVQLLYILCYFQDIGVQHNDLHINNIFIESTPVNLHLKFPKAEFKFFTNYVVRVFDFDRSNVVPTAHNGLMDIENIMNTGPTSRMYCAYNENNFGKRDTGELFYSLNMIMPENDKFIKKLINYCLPKKVIDMKPIQQSYASDEEFKKFKGFKPQMKRLPCTVYDKNKFEIIKEVKSAGELMTSIISPREINILKTKLLLPDTNYQIVRNELPSSNL